MVSAGLNLIASKIPISFELYFYIYLFMEKQRILQRKATLFEERIIFLDYGLEIITKKVKLNQVREMTQEMASFQAESDNRNSQNISNTNRNFLMFNIPVSCDLKKLRNTLELDSKHWAVKKSARQQPVISTKSRSRLAQKVISGQPAD